MFKIDFTREIPERFKKKTLPVEMLKFHVSIIFFTIESEVNIGPPITS